MSSTLLNKYLIKKKKDLLEYAKILESLITLENNTLWKNKSEFNLYAKEVINNYVNDYYFDNNIHRDNPIEYSNDNINSILKSLIVYCKENNKLALLNDNKNETFLLSVIVTTSAYLDIATNIVDGNYYDTKAKFKYLLEYFQKTNILKVYINNSRLISSLFEKIRSNRSSDEKFFNSFEELEIKNNYLKENDYYQVDFEYKLKGIYDNNLIMKIKKNYEDTLKEISLELLEVRLIKELITNNEVNKYLIKVDKDLNKESYQNITDSILKDYVKIEEE